jgi:hypothetical protein
MLNQIIVSHAIPVPGPRSRKRRRGNLVLLAVVGIFALGCARSPSFEERIGEEWRAADWTMTQARIQRDGATIIAHFVFEAPSGDRRVLLENHMRVEPEVSFVAGSWRRIQGTEFTGRGPIRALSVEFMGGQGGRPSVGGTFVLQDDDSTERYRVKIPPTEALEVTWP